MHETATTLYFIDDAIFLDGGVVTLRKESKNDPLSLKDERQTDHYNNLPMQLKSKFPLLGTHYISSNDGRRLLTLSDSTMVYMVKKYHQHVWDQNSWESTGMHGFYIAHSGYYFEVLKRTMRPGQYYLDSGATAYLFETGKKILLSKKKQ